MEDLKHRIRHWRLAAGLSVADMAEACGVTVGAVYQWEAGTARPDPDRFPTIAEACGVALHIFFRPLPQAEAAS